MHVTFGRALRCSADGPAQCVPGALAACSEALTRNSRSAVPIMDGLSATRAICALVARGERPYTPIVVRVLGVHARGAARLRLCWVDGSLTRGRRRAGADGVVQRRGARALRCGRHGGAAAQTHQRGQSAGAAAAAQDGRACAPRSRLRGGSAAGRRAVRPPVPPPRPLPPPPSFPPPPFPPSLFRQVFVRCASRSPRGAPSYPEIAVSASIPPKEKTLSAPTQRAYERTCHLRAGGTSEAPPSPARPPPPSPSFFSINL